jgi:hypothetical protein
VYYRFRRVRDVGGGEFNGDHPLQLGLHIDSVHLAGEQPAELGIEVDMRGLRRRHRPGGRLWLRSWSAQARADECPPAAGDARNGEQSERDEGFGGEAVAVRPGSGYAAIGV